MHHAGDQRSWARSDHPSSDCAIRTTSASPRASITKLHAEIVLILCLAEIRERLVNEGATVVASTPDEFVAFLKKEMATNAKIVQVSGMNATN